MIVLQSLWENNKGLHLWAESSDLFQGTNRGRKKVHQEDAHNFVLPYSVLVDLASEISENWDSHSVHKSSLKVLLPSTDKGPIPSDERLGSSIDEPILTGHKIKLKPWQIETLFLDPGMVLEYLTTLKKQPDSLILGNSLRFWTEAAKLALELVARESILPGFNSEEREGVRYCEATWEAMIEGHSQERLKLLGDSMPPCCRAIQYSGKEDPSPGALIRNFLNQTVNGFIHKKLAEELKRTDKLKSTKMTSITSNWLKALASTRNQIKVSETDATNILQELDSWLSQVKFTPAETALRASFRLEPPENQDEEWHLAFNLQASADRSLLIPADKIWQTRTGVITLLKQRFENPQERLLADLGKASRIFPPIEESLKNACPLGVKLHSENAYQFLREYASLLEQSGFGVLLPAWWQKPELRLGSKLKLKPKTGTKQTGSGLLGLDSIVAYEWEISLGETVLSRKEFEQLAGLKVPLVKIRGQWIELNPEEIKKPRLTLKKLKKVK